MYETEAYLILSILSWIVIVISPVDKNECISDPCQNVSRYTNEENIWNFQCKVGYDGITCKNGKFFMIYK